MATLRHTRLVALAAGASTMHAPICRGAAESTSDALGIAERFLSSGLSAPFLHEAREITEGCSATFDCNHLYAATDADEHRSAQSISAANAWHAANKARVQHPEGGRAMERGMLAPAQVAAPGFQHRLPRQQVEGILARLGIGGWEPPLLSTPTRPASHPPVAWEVNLGDCTQVPGSAKPRRSHAGWRGEYVCSTCASHPTTRSATGLAR